MRLMRHIALALGLFAMTGCGVLGGIASAGDKAPIVAAGDKVIVEGGRALILANATYKAVGTAAAIGIERGVITGETKVRVKAASQRVVDALVAGDKALSTADKAVSAAGALSAIDELCKLHPSLAAACALVK